MGEKLFTNVRLGLKMDTLENWGKSTLALKKGEVAFAVTEPTAENGLTETVVMMKIGQDGVKTFNDIEYNFYAKASDVLAAAKSEDSLKAFINGVIAEAGIASDDAVADLADRVGSVENAVGTLNGDASTEGSVAKAIADAIAALNLADTYAEKEHTHSWNDLTDRPVVEVEEAQAIELVAPIENGTATFTIDQKHMGRECVLSYSGDQQYNAWSENFTLGVEPVIISKMEFAPLVNFTLTDSNNIQCTLTELADATGEIKLTINTVATTECFDDKYISSNIARVSDIEETLKGYQIAGNYATKEEAKGYADAKDSAIAEAKQAGEDAMAEAQKKVASVSAGDASVAIGGTSTAPVVSAKLSADADNALTLAEDGLKVTIPAAAEYSIVKAADSGEYAAVYNLTKDGTIVGASINIPKDIVVKSGSVVGDEIVLVLNDEAGTEIKIPVASLIEYVTSGSSTGDMVVVNVSDDHKVTATITDGTITLAKLTTEVQTAIGKAHTHENADVINAITADDVEKWNGAEQSAKDHADGLNNAMNTRVEALEKDAHTHGNKDLLDTYTQTEANLADAVTKKHSHANATELDKFVDGDKAKLDAAVQTVTTGTGLTATKTGTEVAINLDETVTFIFDCGGADVTA